MRLHRPAGARGRAGALLWIHGGGMVIGAAVSEDRLCRRWADELGVVVGGASAGGGLAAGLALLVRERGGVELSPQLLVYPMIDDRTTTATTVDQRHMRLWSPAANRFGWRCYLGALSGDAVLAPAAPARAEDLAGLAPAWIGVGTLDLFHDEDLAYAQRLREAGVACDLEVVQGAYHGFDIVQPRARVSREFLARQSDALRTALTG